MLTQCPHCLTLFRVKPEQLKVAAGKVRCCQCNSVFNALHRLHESPVAFTRDASESSAQDGQVEMAENEVSSGQKLDSSRHSKPQSFDLPDEQTDGLYDDTLPSTDAAEADLRADELPVDEASSELSDFIYERDDGLEPEPDYFAAGTESQMSELLDQDSTSTLLSEEFSEAVPQETAEVLDFKPQDDSAAQPPETPIAWESFGDSILKDDSFDTAGERPDYDSIPAFRDTHEAASPASVQPDDERVYAFQATEDDKKQHSHRLPWMIGVLLLLLVLCGQLAWQWRESLIQHDAGRQLLGAICRIADCDLPVRRDTGKILVQGRNLSTHPDKPDVLYMQLSMANTATFEQPYPKLQLTLYNDKGKPIARRTFTPPEYLPSEMTADAMMPRAQTVLVELELADPGSEVTGFTFDFL